MSQPINLNKARKQKLRAGQKAQADANAIKFGRSKARRQAEAAETEKAARHLDGHKTDE
jgi:hypothetical protein